MNRILLYALSSLLYVAVPATSTMLSNLPAEAIDALNSRLPGWSFATVDAESLQICGAQVKKPMTPTLVWGDFNGDTVRDFGALVDVGGRARVVAVMSHGRRYVVQDLEAAAGSLLIVLRRGSEYWNHERDKASVVRFDTIGVVFCQRSAVAFVYEDGRFGKVWISD